MLFCTECKNMYYLKIGEEDSNKLINYCRHCGHENVTIGNNQNCISKINVKKTNINQFM